MKKHYYTIDVTTFSPQALKTPYDDCLVGLVLTKNGNRALDVVQYNTYNFIKYYIDGVDNGKIKLYLEPNTRSLNYIEADVFYQSDLQANHNSPIIEETLKEGIVLIFTLTESDKKRINGKTIYIPVAVDQNIQGGGESESESESSADTLDRNIFYSFIKITYNYSNFDFPLVDVGGGGGGGGVSELTINGTTYDATQDIPLKTSDLINDSGFIESEYDGDMVIDGDLTVTGNLNATLSFDNLSVTNNLNVGQKVTTNEGYFESGIEAGAANINSLNVAEDGLLYNGYLYQPITLNGTYIDGTTYTLTVLGRLTT